MTRLLSPSQKPFLSRSFTFHSPFEPYTEMKYPRTSIKLRAYVIIPESLFLHTRSYLQLPHERGTNDRRTELTMNKFCTFSKTLLFGTNGSKSRRKTRGGMKDEEEICASILAVMTSVPALAHGNRSRRQKPPTKSTGKESQI